MRRLYRDGALSGGRRTTRGPCPLGAPARLARELGLSYATLALSMNHAAGRGTSAQGIRLEDADVVLKVGMEKIRTLLAKAVELHAAMPTDARGLAESIAESK